MDSTTYNVALCFHLLGALLFVAGIVLAGAAFEAARRRQQPAEIALLLSMTRIGVLVVAVGALLLAAFGLWLVHLGNWGYGTRLGRRLDGSLRGRTRAGRTRRAAAQAGPEASIRAAR
jgi:hypothetical protein